MRKLPLGVCLVMVFAACSMGPKPIPELQQSIVKHHRILFLPVEFRPLEDTFDLFEYCYSYNWGPKVCNDAIDMFNDSMGTYLSSYPDDCEVVVCQDDVTLADLVRYDDRGIISSLGDEDLIQDLMHSYHTNLLACVSHFKFICPRDFEEQSIYEFQLQIEIWDMGSGERLGKYYTTEAQAKYYSPDHVYTFFPFDNTMLMAVIADTADWFNLCAGLPLQVPPAGTP